VWASFVVPSHRKAILVRSRRAEILAPAIY
jgi:hypothetical protein